MNPEISVLMPVYNGEKYLREAIGSMLTQSFSNFELILINDGSTDSTEKIIKSFEDKRIVYIDNGENLGLAASFNAGIEVARGNYLARMDADDIAIPERLEKQLSFLKRKPHIGIVGSSIIIIDEKGEELDIHKRPLSHKEIKYSSLFSTPMYHPTVLGRMEIFKKYLYNETFSNSEDYELWSRLLFSTEVKFANINEPLLRYRVYPQSFTQTLNLDRRALSAHNTVRNVEQYVKLRNIERKFIIHLRQELFLSPIEIFSGFILYLRASFTFLRREKPGLRETAGIVGRYLRFILSVLKHEVRKLIRP